MQFCWANDRRFAANSCGRDHFLRVPLLLQRCQINLHLLSSSRRFLILGPFVFCMSVWAPLVPFALGPDSVCRLFMFIVCLFVCLFICLSVCLFSQSGSRSASQLVRRFLLAHSPLGRSVGRWRGYDVLHDLADPEQLIREVRSVLADEGVWVIVDIASHGAEIDPPSRFLFVFCFAGCAISRGNFPFM